MMLLAAILCAGVVQAAAAGCEVQHDQLMGQIQQVSAEAEGMGICQAARALADIYQQTANLLRECPTLDPTGQDADAYQQGVYDAQNTASAACSN